MSKLIAHRGASLLALENTETAFELAAKEPHIYGIETDLWITLDNVWICSHDSNPFVNKNIHIHKSNYNDIKDLPLSIPNAKFQATSTSCLCTFDKYIDICQKYQKSPIIELKQTNTTKPQLEDLINKIKDKKMLTFTSFISFEYHVLNLLREVDHHVPTYDLIDTKFAKNGLGKNGIKLSIAMKSNVSVRDFLATKKIVNLVHQNKLFISVWTIDKKSQGLKYQRRGVDFITTNNIKLFD